MQLFDNREKRPEQTTPLLHIDISLQYRIVEYCDFADLPRLFSTCLSLHDLRDDPALWGRMNQGYFAYFQNKADLLPNTMQHFIATYQQAFKHLTDSQKRLVQAIMLDDIERIKIIAAAEPETLQKKFPVNDPSKPLAPSLTPYQYAIACRSSAAATYLLGQLEPEQQVKLLEYGVYRHLQICATQGDKQSLKQAIDIIINNTPARKRKDKCLHILTALDAHIYRHALLANKRTINEFLDQFAYDAFGGANGDRQAQHEYQTEFAKARQETFVDCCAQGNESTVSYILQHEQNPLALLANEDFIGFQAAVTNAQTAVIKLLWQYMGKTEQPKLLQQKILTIITKALAEWLSEQPDDEDDEQLNKDDVIKMLSPVYTLCDGELRKMLLDSSACKAFSISHDDLFFIPKSMLNTTLYDTSAANANADGITAHVGSTEQFSI